MCNSSANLNPLCLCFGTFRFGLLNFSVMGDKAITGMVFAPPLSRSYLSALWRCAHFLFLSPWCSDFVSVSSLLLSAYFVLTDCRVQPPPPPLTALLLLCLSCCVFCSVVMCICCLLQFHVKVCIGNSGACHQHSRTPVYILAGVLAVTVSQFQVHCRRLHVRPLVCLSVVSGGQAYVCTHRPAIRVQATVHCKPMRLNKQFGG